MLHVSNNESMDHMIKRIGMILRKCPLSDTTLKEGKNKKYKAICPVLDNEVGKNGMEKGDVKTSGRVKGTYKKRA